MKKKVVKAIFRPNRDDAIVYDHIYQWDFGQTLEIQGLNLPEELEVHFAVARSKRSITRIAMTTDKITTVSIPDELLEQSRGIKAYLYVSDDEQGETAKVVHMNIIPRPKPDDRQPSDDTKKSMVEFVLAVVRGFFRSVVAKDGEVADMIKEVIGVDDEKEDEDEVDDDDNKD